MLRFMVLVWLCLCCNLRKFGFVCDLGCGKRVLMAVWCW